MRVFLLKRLLQTIPLLLAVSVFSFLIIHLAPGDFINTLLDNPQIRPETIARLRHNFGLDLPWYVQYAKYLERIVLHGDFGESFATHQPALTVIRPGLFNTLLLASSAALITWLLAIPLGIIA